MDSPGPTSSNTAPAPPSGFLAKLGLHRPELLAWALYDWANSAFVTTIMTAVFPLYYLEVAGEAGMSKTDGQLRFALITSAALVFIAVLAPVLGALADFLPIKKRLLGGFLVVGAFTCAGMFFIQPGMLLLADVLFVASNIAVNGSFVFYDSLLPHIAGNEEVDRVSTAGYALGYVGGGVLLAVQLLFISFPEWLGLDKTMVVRLSFVSVGAWWLLFSIPLFRHVPEPALHMKPPGAGLAPLVKATFTQLGRTFRELRSYRDAFIMLIAFLIYNDGIGTIIRMAGQYADVTGIDQGTVIGAIMITQFVGIPCAFLFGMLAGRIGSKPAIFLGLVVYAAISILGYHMKTGMHFLLLALLVGMVQGGTQALSRSLFASMIPRQQSGQFFGFFAVVEKFAGILGPMIFFIAGTSTGSSRSAILSVIAFFIVGGVLLGFVNVQRGQHAARAAEAKLMAASSS